MMMNRTFVRACIIALAVGGVSGLAWGQVAPNYTQNGHMLDKNPQVGGGGSNSPVSGYVPAATGNDIITGNVSGLGYFHGNVPYRNQFEFGGTVGNSSVNNFVRQSAGTSNGSTYLGGSTSFVNPASVVSSSTGINPGDVRSNAVSSGVDGSFSRAQVDGGRLNIYSPGSSIQVQPGGTVVNMPARFNREQTSADITSNPYDPNVTVSPLFGILQRDPSAQAPENQFQNNGPQMNNSANPSDNGQGRTPGSYNPDDPKNPNNRIRTDNGVKDQRNGLMEGQVAQGKVDERVRGAAQSQLVGQTNSQLVVSDEYKDLLTQLQKNREEEQKREVASAQTNGKKMTGPEFMIDPVTGQLRVHGPDDKPAAGTGKRPADGSAGLAGREPTRDATSALRAARGMPPLETLAGRAGTPFNQLMAGAEMRLRIGKYFEAADLYQQAMDQQPTNMLPIVGRAHAELAGGMYESAAYDLKFVFERKPEMIGLRYQLEDVKSDKPKDVKLGLMPAERLRFLSKDLKSLSSEKGMETAFFLLAYLEYQEAQSDALDSTLTDWAAKLPRDEWVSAMRHAWLDAKDAPKLDAAPPGQK